MKKLLKDIEIMKDFFELKGKTTKKELCEKFKTSPATITKYLSVLECRYPLKVERKVIGSPRHKNFHYEYSIKELN